MSDGAKHQEPQEAWSSTLSSRLTGIAARAQRLRTLPEMFGSAGAGLLELGIAFNVCRLTAPDELQVIHYSAPGGHPEDVAGALGRAPTDFVLPLSKLRSAATCLESGRCAWEADTAHSVGELFEGAPRQQRVLTRTQREQGLSRGFLCPLLVCGRPWGLATVASDHFQEADGPAVELFATQLSTAVELLESFARLERGQQELLWLRALSDVGRRPREQMVPEILRLATEATGSDFVALYAIDADHADDLMLLGWRGGGPEPSQPQQRRLGYLTQFVRSVSRGAPRVTTPEEWPEPARRELVAAGLNRGVLLDLHLGERQVGTLVLMRRGGSTYSPAALRWCESMAQQVAVELENARLQMEIEQRLDDLTSISELSERVARSLDLGEVLRTGVQHLARLMSVEQVYLALLESDEYFRIVATTPSAQAAVGVRVKIDEHSLTSLAIKERRPIATADSHHDPRASKAMMGPFPVRSSVIIPLFMGEKVIGGILAGDAARGRVFSDVAVQRAAAVSQQLAAAITNARLYEQERKRVEELRLFLEVSEVVAQSLDLDEILDSSAARMTLVANAEHAFCWLLDRDGHTLRGAATSDASLRAEFRRLVTESTGKSGAGLAVRARRAVQLADAIHSEEISPQLREFVAFKSLLSIPLMVRDEVIGAITLGNRKETQVWSEAEVERATLMARQVAVAVSNARLYEDLRHSYDELARTQEALVKRERLAALGELSAVMAHEVRNPLGVIFNAIGGLQKILRPQGDAALLLRMVGEEADRLNRIVGDLLDFARPKEPELQPESIEMLVNGALEAATVDVAAEVRDLEVEVNVEPELPRVLLDGRMLRQALVNLVLNAFQAMAKDGGGHLNVRARQTASAGDPVVEISVEDTGPGLPPGLEARIFEPFFTTKASGTGLGLSVVKHIIEAHHGSIRVERRLPRGTSFVVTLPLESPAELNA